MRVVISQPMFFPWIGIFEQIRLAEVYVHYCDVQFSKGSFVNRVQIKTASGTRWLTVPLRDLRLGMTISEVRIDDRLGWRRQHLKSLKQSYAKAPFLRDMLQLVERVYAEPCATIGQLSTASLAASAEYYRLNEGRSFVGIEDLGVSGSGSQRVLDIVKKLGGTEYVSGLGGLCYLEHDQFAAAGVEVQYMNYNKTPYPQLHGDFTPFVSILDLVANVGPEGERYIRSGTRNWRAIVR